MMPRVTDRQRVWLRTIWQMTHGPVPATYREIADAMGVGPSGAAHTVKALDRKGLVTNDPRQRIRSLRLTRAGWAASRLNRIEGDEWPAWLTTESGERLARVG